MRIILTGGGTAGHVKPVLEVAKHLGRNARVKMLYVGSRQGIEKKMVPESGLPFKALVVGKRRTYFSLANFWDYFKTIIGIVQAYFLLVTFKPDVVFAKGGYVTLPILFWVKIFKLPLVIHESDVVMGRTNLWALKFARKACLGFPVKDYSQNLPLEKLIYTGIPVDEEFSKTVIQSDERPKILVTGGSQGSTKINDLIAEILPELLEKYEVWHLSGERDYEKLAKIKDPYYHVFAFSADVAKFLRASELIITRAGASTLMEIAAATKPAIVIPLPSAAQDHQEANAKVFAAKNAAVVLSEKNLTATSLKEIILQVLADGEMRALLGRHAQDFYRPDSTEEIIQTIFEAARCSADSTV